MKVVCIKHASYNLWKYFPEINEVCEVSGDDGFLTGSKVGNHDDINVDTVYGIYTRNHPKLLVYYPRECFITIDEYREKKLEEIFN